jgi:hypothetical protein
MVSQVLTLYITPVFYLYMEKVARYLTPKPVRDIEREEAGLATPGMAK